VIIAAIAELLGVPADMLEECRATIVRDVENAKWRIARGKGDQPGTIKKDIGPIRAAAAKLQKLTRKPTLGKAEEDGYGFGRPFFGHALFPDFLDHHVNFRTDRNYEALQACLSAVIEACDRLEQEIVVPAGKKPHEYARYEARTIAENLVAEFSVMLDRDKLEADIASRVYELLTGRKDVAIPENAAELKPPTIQTRRRVGA
jgi:hypothetical protein